jgi:hypothetical protein
VHQTLAAAAEQITDPGVDSRRPGAEQSRTNVPEKIQPAACASGPAGICPGPAAVDLAQDGSWSTVPSRAGLSAGRRRRRRDAEVLLVVRRAEQGRGLPRRERVLRSES